jgi:predicted MFS family arabinose efflux permease
MVRCFVLTLFSAALWSLLPLVAKNMVGGGPSVYGLMLGALGIGALGGAGFIGWMRDRLGYRRLFAISSLCIAVTTLAMATVSAVIPLLIILAIGGLGWMISMSTFNLVVQMSAAETHRGRAISVYYIALFGGLALGSWAFGHVAELVSVRAGLLIATAGLAASLVLYRARSSAPHPFSEQPAAVPAE